MSPLFFYGPAVALFVVASSTHYVQLKVVSETLSTLHLHQDGVCLLRAEADRQTICSRARSLVGGPGVRDQSAPFPKYIRGPSCSKEREKKEREKKTGEWMEILHFFTGVCRFFTF